MLKLRLYSGDVILNESLIWLCREVSSVVCDRNCLWKFHRRKSEFQHFLTATATNWGEMREAYIEKQQLTHQIGGLSGASFSHFMGLTSEQACAGLSHTGQFSSISQIGVSTAELNPATWLFLKRPNPRCQLGKLLQEGGKQSVCTWLFLQWSPEAIFGPYGNQALGSGWHQDKASEQGWGTGNPIVPSGEIPKTNRWWQWLP